MVLLEYDPDDDEPFHDEPGSTIYYPGEREVPAEDVGRLLENDSWGRAATTEGDSLDVSTFLENEHTHIVDEIEAGNVDDYLEEIRNHEQNRTEATGPRSSVLNSVEERLDEITSTDDDSDTDEDSDEEPRDVDVVSGGAPDSDEE